MPPADPLKTLKQIYSVILAEDPDSDSGETVEEIRDILTKDFPEITEKADKDVTDKSQEIIELLEEGGYSVLDKVMEYFNR
jgi:hypothetical protein